MLVATALMLGLLVPSSSTAAFGDPELIIADAGNRNAMVTTPEGETVVAWQEEVPDDSKPFGTRQELWVAVKPANGPLGKPELISRDIADCTVQLEVDGQGNVALSWGRYTMQYISTTLRRPGGQWQEPLAVPEADNSGGNGYKMDVAGGDVAVGFAHYDIEDNQISAVYRATISRDGQPYGEYGTLAQSGFVDHWDHEPGGFDLALSPSGEVSMVWARTDNDLDDGPWIVQTAHLSPEGVPSAVQTLADDPAEKSCPQIDADDAGNVAVLWMAEGCGSRSLQLATRGPGQAFGPPFTVSEGPDGAPELDLGAADGTLAVGYSQMDTLRTAYSQFPDPPQTTDGAHGRFEDINVLDAGLAVVGAWTDSGDLMVGNIAADGTVERGPTVETDSYFPLVGPLPAERAAVLAYEYGKGLRLWTGSLEIPPPPEPEPEPEVPGEPEPGPAVPGGGPVTQTVNQPGQLDLFDGGTTELALARELQRQVGCSVACTVRASAKIGVPVRGGGNRVFRLRGSSRSGLAWSPIDVNLRVRREAYRVALGALRRGRPVQVQLRLAATAPGLPEARRKSTVSLQRPAAG